MFRVLVWLMLFTVNAALGQVEAPAVTTSQLDAAVEQVNTTLAEDDPGRASLLKLYADTRAALEDFQSYSESVETFNLARANAPGEVESLQAKLAEIQAQPLSQEDDESLTKITVEEAEQLIQVDRAEHAALKGRIADTRAELDGMPGRAAAIRDRLTELIGVLAKLESQTGLMNQSAEPGTEDEARLWLAQAEIARGTAEKESLDAELLSQPMRKKLRKAQLDTTNHDISVLESRLEILEQRAGDLRQGEAEEALAQAELVRAGAEGKHELVQRLADENAELTASFSQRSGAIEQTRQRESASQKSAEQLENDLTSIERKLEILGMTTAIGEILREQSVQLPSRREARKAAASVGHNLRESSLRQVELEDERRQLRHPDKFVERHIGILDPELMERIGDDLTDLTLNRRELVKKAVQLENTYSSALGNLEFTLRRYDTAVENYRDFISERLLWIPSRDAFSMFSGGGLPGQVTEIFAPGRWLDVIRVLPRELMQQPMIILVMLLSLVFIYLGPRLVKRLQDTGQTVGYAKTDLYSNTIYALGYSLLLALTWPLPLLAFAWLFELQEAESELAAALGTALSRMSLYFWGMEFMRVMLLPKGLAASHFRWPAPRVKRLRKSVVRLEQTFIPATFLVIFAISLYPREVGGQLGALGVSFTLFSIAWFFHRIPQFVQGNIDLIFVDRQPDRTAFWGKLIRLLLTWVPVAAIVAVLMGYSYTAIEFALLLVETVVLYSGLLLFQELGLRFLRLTRRRMVIKVREEQSQDSDEEGEPSPEEDLLETDPELLSDEGTKLLQAMVVLGSLLGTLVIWAEVFPALGILDTVELWHHTGVIDGREATVPVTLRDLFSAFFILVLGGVVVRRIPSLLEILLRQRMHISPGSAYAATRVFQYSLTTILVLSVVGALGGSWGQMQWAVAALSLGIGFGLQEIVANFISGLIILFEQPIRVGDTVTVGEVSGTVTKIRIRATTVRDWDRRELLVPNKEFVTKQLLNWSLSDSVTRIIFQVGVAYGTDMSKAMRIVRRIAREHPLVLADPEPFITFDEFGDNSLAITVRVYIDELDKRIQTASEIRLAINEQFSEAGIVVAFPQRDVHLDTSGPLEVTMVEQGVDEPPGSP